jgi:Flp pilus assembly pilin Flp
MEILRTVSDRVGGRVMSIGLLGSDESGQAMVEYALLLSLIAIVSVGIVQTMGLSLSGLYSKINAIAFR